MSSFTFETTPRIVCMQGGSERLREFVALLEARRVLVVTDAGLVQAGVVEPILAALRAGGIEAELYSEVRADPPEEMVNSAVEFARSKAADLVVGLGGGSAMDTAKFVALLAGSSQALTCVVFLRPRYSPRLARCRSAGSRHCWSQRGVDFHRSRPVRRRQGERHWPRRLQVRYG